MRHSQKLFELNHKYLFIFFTLIITGIAFENNALYAASKKKKPNAEKTESFDSGKIKVAPGTNPNIRLRGARVEGAGDPGGGILIDAEAPDRSRNVLKKREHFKDQLHMDSRDIK